MAVIRGLMLLFFVFTVENATAKKCSFGWTPFCGECYKFFNNQVNWVTAEKNCQSFDANLASVSNKIQNDFLLSLVPAETRVWVGGHDGEQDGQWLWSDGSAFGYINWCPTEPNNNKGPENCLEINFSTNRCWNDQSCLTQFGYICVKHL